MQTRSSVITHHVRLAIAHSGLTLQSYANCVALRYHADVPLHLRGIAFHATGDDQVFPARAHFLRRQVDRLQARGAKAVDLHASAAKIPARQQRSHLGQHGTLVAHWGHHTPHHVVHLSGVELMALLQLGQ